MVTISSLILLESLAKGQLNSKSPPGQYGIRLEDVWVALGVLGKGTLCVLKQRAKCMSLSHMVGSTSPVYLI